MFNYERFEELRRSKGITKKFIAQSLGRSASLCQDWKQKKSQPSEEQLRQLADILGCSAAWLRGEDESPEEANNLDMEELLTQLRDREDIRMLFLTAKDASPEDVLQAVKIIEALRKHD